MNKLVFIKQFCRNFSFLTSKDDLPTSGLYSDVKSQRYLMDRMGKLLKIQNLEDWYSIKQSDVAKIGGLSLIQHYFGGSLIRGLIKVYPEYNWKIYKFNNVPLGFWKEHSNRRNFLESIANELNIQRLDDWRFIKADDLKKLGGSGLLSYFKGSLKSLLTSVFPEHNWNFDGEKNFPIENRVPTLGKGQMRLFKIIKHELFPEYEVFSEYILDEKMKIKVDIAIPKLNLVLEYQGEMHYKDQRKKMFSDEQRLKKDEEKQKYCKENNITLIEIPFWWNGSVESLQATLFKYRPELFSFKPQGKPILSLEELPKAAHNVARSKNPFRIKSKLTNT